MWYNYKEVIEWYMFRFYVFSFLFRGNNISLYVKKKTTINTNCYTWEILFFFFFVRVFFFILEFLIFKFWYVEFWYWIYIWSVCWFLFDVYLFLFFLFCFFLLLDTLFLGNNIYANRWSLFVFCLFLLFVLQVL